MPHATPALVRFDRFWEARPGPLATACHVWFGSCHRNGYGTFYAGREATKRMMYAHRFAFEQVNGPVPRGLCVLHECDNPSCVNPAHLFVGTMADNNADMWAKSRGRHGHLYGNAHPGTKLSDSELAEVRTLWVNRGRRRAAEGLSLRALAKRYGMSQSGLWHAINKRTP